MTWGATKERLKSLDEKMTGAEGEIKGLKSQIEIIGRLDVMTNEIRSAVRRLHDRIDHLETAISSLDRSVAVLDERSGYTPVHGVPIYKQATPRKPAPSETSEPPKTKRKDDK